MSFDFFPNEQNNALLNAERHPSTLPEAGTWSNFLPGAGQFAMRSLAEAGRAVSMAGAVVPIMADKLVGDDNFSGKSLTDQYFAAHDEIFNNAVDYWTPKPGEVGTAGQVAGQLAGGVMQAIVSPALLVGTAQLSAAEDLVRQGVDASTANAVGAVQGTSMAVGIKLPYLGQTLATRVLSGAGGNLAQGTAGALASSEVLKSQGYDKQAEQYNPWDLRARALDVMLGAAFGGLAHLEARSSADLTPQEDYKRFLAEYGLTEERVQKMTQNTADQIPMPPGVAKIERRTSPIAGEGMFATEDVKPGDVLAPARIDGMRTPAGRFTNHSNKPNAEMRALPGGDLELVALTPIERGAEVVINYRQAAEASGWGKLTPTDEAALLVANQARHLEDATPQGRPATDADATMHANAMRQAIDQVLRGERVSVDDVVKDMRTVPDEALDRQRSEVMDEALLIAAQDAPLHPPIVPPMDPNAKAPDVMPIEHDPTTITARRFAQEQPDLAIPLNRVDADGNPMTMRAADAIALADAEAAHVKTVAADLFRTAANCLLGAL